jgi:hypothetical protein
MRIVDKNYKLKFLEFRERSVLEKNVHQTFDLGFYTCYYGPDNNNHSCRIPNVPSVKYNCYYYTNNKNLFNQLQNTKWIAIFDDKHSSDDIIETTNLSKHIRTSPHKYEELAKYTYLCGFDSKQEVSEKFVEHSISEYFVKNNFAIALRKHPWRGNEGVWAEFAESMLQERYVLQKDSYLNYINKQLASGLKHLGPGVAGGWVIRNMKHPKTEEINNTWYNHILECGIQDQISLFFVNQLFQEYIAVYDRDPSV